MVADEDANVLLAVNPAAGAGCCFLVFFGLIVVGLFFWVIHWSLQGFRASFPRSRAGRIALRVFVGLVAVLVAAFPPRRRMADWKDEATGEPIPASIALEFDRATYGYLPSYGWIGTIGREERRDARYTRTSGNHGPYQCGNHKWVIDRTFLSGQTAALGVLLLPFLRARPNSGEPDTAKAT